MKKHIDSVADAITGTVLANASVTVYKAGTTNLASLFADHGITPRSNPVFTNSTGLYWFYIANGTYDIVISKTNYPAQTLSGVEIESVYHAQDFGAVCDGVTDDLAALQTACNVIYANGGGTLYLEPGKSAYKISNSLFVPNGVQICGQVPINFNSVVATNAQWTAFGSWLYCTHPVNSAVVLSGHGAAISGIGFIHDQPIPTGGSWTPNIYGYCIEVLTSFTTIRDILIVNASHGVFFNYTSVSGGGTHVVIDRVNISTFVIGLRTKNVNDTMYMSNIHSRNLWYASDSRVIAYIRDNRVGWKCGYTDNIMIDGLEFFEDSIGILFEDETCLGNTHSLYNATMVNVQFNLPKVAMKVASTTTTAVATISGIAQAGNAFGYTWADTLFQLDSDNVKLEFPSLKVLDSGGVVFNLGGGVGGKLVFGNLSIDQYSTIAAAQPCITLNSGTDIRLGSYRIFKPGTAGLRFAGAGLESILTNSYGEILYFSKLSEISITGNGSYQTVSTSSYLRPGQMGVHQARLIGDLIVTTASAGTTASVRSSTLPELLVTGINTAALGSVAFDTGWMDISEANLAALQIFGAIQIQASAPVVLANGNIQILYR